MPVGLLSPRDRACFLRSPPRAFCRPQHSPPSAAAMVMCQAVYLCVASWMSEVPLSTHSEHIARRRLSAVARVYLDFSAAAWSPSRAAMLQVALRLIASWGSRRVEEMQRTDNRLGRQWFRAMQPVLNLSPLETVTTRLRRLVRMYRVSAEITRRLVRSRPELAEVVAALREDVERFIVDDVSSEGSDES